MSTSMGLLLASPHSRAGQIVAAACVIAMLYFGRGFLAPLALAGILSLVLAPLKRKLARLGLGHTAGALVSVLLVAACIACVATVLASQLFAVAADMPQYKEAVREKLERARDVTLRPLEQLAVELGGVVPRPSLAATSKPPGRTAKAPAEPQPAAEPSPQPRKVATDTATRILTSVWGPLGQAGIVLVLLVFILLEHEALRDRMIRLAGEAQAGRTMQALEDAAQGVSRFFFSQFIVNATFGAVLACVLWMVGIPHAALWGALGGLARFVPYIGALGAGAIIAAFAAAVDPGWTLVVWSLALFVTLELLVAHVVEPRVYGHSTGIAPLGVIVAALFWAALWGPLGLLLATPITLCLVVAGRHVRALQPISILLGDPPGLTAGLRLYQRALSGESGEIVTAAGLYLRRSNFARYCDQIALPGLALAAADFRAGRIGNEQQERIHHTIATVAGSLGALQARGGASRRRRSTSLLEANVGAHLHEASGQRLGPGRRSPAHPDLSGILCVGLGSVREDVLSGLLVQALRDEGVDARALSMAASRDMPQPQRSVLSTVFLAYPLQENRAAWQEAARELRALLPQAMLLTIKPPLEDGAVDETLVARQVDLAVGSFSEAVAFVLGGRAGRA